MVKNRHWKKYKNKTLIAGVTGGVCDSGIKQSPIDLNTCYIQQLDPLRLTGHGDSRTEGFVLKNTGHTGKKKKKRVFFFTEFYTSMLLINFDKQ
jgi:carbonic anhydrase